MTRINSGIKPVELSNKLLIAELYEIIRLPTLSAKYGLKNLNKIPETFRLGNGHVKFFYNKGHYTLNRYKKLRKEALKRGMKVNNFESKWENLPEELMKNWKETNEARKEVLKRFSEKGWKLEK